MVLYNSILNVTTEICTLYKVYEGLETGIRCVVHIVRQLIHQQRNFAWSAAGALLSAHIVAQLIHW
jgi:hypothetical protein